VVEEAETATHLALFQSRDGDEQPGRAAVLDGQRPAVEVPRHPGPPAGHVGQRQVGGVAGVAEGEDVAGRRLGPAASRSVSTDTPPKVTPSFDQLVTQWMSPA